MKKNFKFMLVALLALFGFNSAWAAPVTFEDGNYLFEITKAPNTSGNGGTVKILGLTDEAKAFKNTDGQEPYINDGVLEFPGEAIHQGVKYTVTTMDSKTFKDVAYYATSVTIPASLTEIPTEAFNTLTNLATINFAPNSQVKRIGAQAFASTRITEFDFTNCVELEGLNDEVFVERWQATEQQPENQNKNSYITKITVPTSPKFKHINAAFRNLTELTEIVNLENSWIQEITERAFQGTKIGTTEAKPLVLPEKDLLYIDQNALKGSNVAYLEIKMGSLLAVGGYKVVPTQVVDPTSDNYGSYTYQYNAVEDGTTNLYGLEAPAEGATGADRIVAPLVSLKLTGTQKGKICTNAFAWCENMNGLDLTELFYGSKAQFETSSFEGCSLVTSLIINPISNNETEGYTFEKEAFKDTPITDLTLKEVKTTKAVGEGAFGSKLKKVIIGTVDANGAAFAADAFKFDGVTGITLALATGEDEYLNSKDATATLIPASAFNFKAIYDLTADELKNFVYPEVTIGEIKSKGAVFADGSLAGPVQKIHFTGDIARNGLTAGGTDTGTNHGVRILAENGASQFKTLIFDGEIGTNGIGSNAFAEFDKLETVTFNGLLAELAVAPMSFMGSGKLGGAAGDAVRYIGTKDAPFVIYDVEEIENWAVNPFASNAFAEAGQEEDPGAPRIIWWEVKNTTLKAEILGAIQKSIQGDDYEGTVYNTKFNVYKWVDLDMKAPEPDEGPSFLFFQDQVGDNKIAWGRYDLGKFEKESGKYATPNLRPEDPKYVAPYKTTDMVIPRIQETTGAKVKITLYGLYWDEDDFGQVSTTYLVPLRVVNGTYQIPSTNEHLIIGKAEIQGEGSFEDKDVKIYYNNVPAEGDGSFTAAWKAGDITETYAAANNAVWEQLATETRVYSKATATDAKTHQELWDVVKRFEGSTTNRAGKNLWVMTDPAKYKGFRVDSNPITKDNYTFIGVDWYYTLLKNYQKEEAARVIWLDEAQATAIFGVKELKAKAAAGDGYIYNLQGVRVSNPSKGLYIQNGKKFIVK